MVAGCIMAYPCLQSFVMCGKIFNLLEVGITEAYWNFQTLQTWTGHDGMHYHNLSALPHALPHAVPYIFSQFNMDRP